MAPEAVGLLLRYLLKPWTERLSTPHLVHRLLDYQFGNLRAVLMRVDPDDPFGITEGCGMGMSRLIWVRSHQRETATLTEIISHRMTDRIVKYRA